MRRRVHLWRRGVGLFVLASLVQGCAEDFPEATHFGEYVEVAAVGEGEFCGGTVAMLDEFVVELSERSDSSLPTSPVYVLAGGQHELRTFCPNPDSEGCARSDDRVVVTMDRFGHVFNELAHRVYDPPGEELPHVLSEGTASLWGGRAEDCAEPGAHPLVVENFDDPPEDEDYPHYFSAPPWIQSLIDAWGMDAFNRFARSTSAGEGVDAIRRAFAEAFDGTDLDGHVAAYNAAPREPPRPLWTCGETDVVFDGEPLALSVDGTGCTDPRAVNSAYSEVTRRYMVVQTLDNTGGNSLSKYALSGPEDLRLRLVNCQCNAFDAIHTIGPGEGNANLVGERFAIVLEFGEEPYAGEISLRLWNE